MAIGVIGGSGIQKLDVITIKDEHEVNTPFGKPSSKIIEAELGGEKFYFLKRHGDGHIYNPSEITIEQIFMLLNLWASPICYQYRQ